MSKKLQLFIKILIGATFFVPLIVLPSSYIFPFIVPKIIWFRSLVLLMLGAYMLLLAINKNAYLPKLTPVTVTVLLFFISFAVSTFVGVDWYRSFWDNHERMLGLFTIVHYIVFYLVATSVVKTWDEWKWMLRVFLFAGSVVMVIGMLQKLNPELLLNRGSDRVSATLGNAIYFSGYGLFLFFIGLLLALKEPMKKYSAWFWYAVAGSAMGFLGIFLGGTRGALLGLIVGLGVLTVSYLVLIRDHKKIRAGIMVVMVCGVFLGSLLFDYRKTDVVSRIPGVGRLVNASLFEGTGATRLMAWDIAIKAWQEKPMFGWGPNNYYYAFNAYYNPKFLEFGWGETWFDNAHSVIMNTLAVQGTVGIVTYAGMLGAVIFVLCRLRKKKNDHDIHIIAVGLAFVIANIVGKAMVFDDPTSYMYFFFFLAFVNAQSRYPDNPDVQIYKKINKNISTGLVVAVGLVMLLLIYSTNINPARANRLTLTTIRSLGSGQLAFDLYAQASSTPTPHIDDIRNDVSRISGTQIERLLQQGKKAEAEKLFDFAYEELKKNLVLHPQDIRVHIQLSTLLIVGAQIKQDIHLFIEAEHVLRQAYEMSPKRQQIIYMLSGIQLQLGKSEEAISLLRQSIEDNPKIEEGWGRLGAMYERLGRQQDLDNLIEEAKAAGVMFESYGKEL